mmetsp:Transcript_25726/g.60046  ORF Transcript_25726/g.60046 Transcript_25726/m.60046 type:complete len:229 (+) Transcript_25726:1200-1886(+)
MWLWLCCSAVGRFGNARHDADPTRQWLSTERCECCRTLAHRECCACEWRQLPRCQLGSVHLVPLQWWLEECDARWWRMHDVDQRRAGGSVWALLQRSHGRHLLTGSEHSCIEHTSGLELSEERRRCQRHVGLHVLDAHWRAVGRRRWHFEVHAQVMSTWCRACGAGPSPRPASAGMVISCSFPRRGELCDICGNERAAGDPSAWHATCSSDFGIWIRRLPFESAQCGQ